MADSSNVIILRRFFQDKFLTVLTCIEIKRFSKEHKRNQKIVWMSEEYLVLQGK